MNNKQIFSIVMIALLIPTVFVAGCTSSDNGGETEEFQIAVLLPGDTTDMAWNESMLEAIKRLNNQTGYDVEYTAGVYEAVDAGPHLRDFAEENDLVIAHGFQYAEITPEVAADFPDTYFLNIAGVQPEEPMENMAVADVRTDEHGYLQGILMAEMSETGHVGYVSGVEVAELARAERGINKAIEDMYPDVNFHSVYTGDFTDVGLARETVTSLVEDQNIDVISSVGDGVTRGTISQAVEEGIYAIGPSVDWSGMYPDKILMSAVWEWDVLIERVVNDIKDDSLVTDQTYWLSMREEGMMSGGVSITEFNEDVPEDVREKINNYAQQIEDGEILTEPLS